MVHLCTNNSRKTQDMGISYHRLPRRPLNGRLVARRGTRHRIVVCSSHFEPDYFEPSREICGYKKPKTMRPSAVPTIFAFTNPPKDTSRASSRRQIEARASEVNKYTVDINR